MDRINHTVALDLQRGIRAQTIRVMEDDTKSRAIKFVISSGGLPFEISNFSAGEVHFRRADGTSDVYTQTNAGEAAVSVSKNVVTALIDKDITQTAGRCRMSVVLKDTSGRQIATFPIIVEVIALPTWGGSGTLPAEKKKYSISRSLTNCTISNTATEIEEGEPYKAVITPDTGTELTALYCTMGNTRMPVDGMSVNITKVVGNITIVASAAGNGAFVSANQGAENAGKVLGIGTDGRVSPVNAEKYDDSEIRADVAGVRQDLTQAESRLSESITKISGASKNLFDPSHFLKIQDAVKTDGECRVVLWRLHGAFGSVNYPIYAEFDSNTSYTLSLDARMIAASGGEGGNGVQVQFVYSDGTKSTVVSVPNSTSTATHYTATSDKSKTLEGVRFTFGSGSGNVACLAKIQLEKSAVETDYVPPITAVDSIAREHLSIVADAVSELDTKQLNAAVFGITTPVFGVYDAEYNNAGWKYYDRTIGWDARRIAIKPNAPLGLSAGDVVGLSDYADARFSVGGRSEGVYFFSPWRTENYTVPKTGEYVFLISHVDNRLIKTQSELEELFFVRKKSYLIKDVSDIKTKLNSLPPYWEEYLDAKIREINDTIDVIGAVGDGFVFFTDYHIENNAGYTSRICRRILEETSISKIFFGGDAFNGNPSKNVALDFLRTFSAEFNFAEFYGIRGNHDNNLNDGGGTPVAIADQQIYNYFTKKNERHICNLLGLNFCVDNPVCGIRYICMDTKNAYTNTVISEDVIAWIRSRITELDNRWSVLIISHGLFNFASSNRVVTEDPGYFGFGRQIIDAIDSVYDSANATIIGVLSGHCHYDYAKNETKGYLCIGTTCDTRQESGGLDRTLGTTNEQAIDVVSIDTSNRAIKTVRVGAGLNRTLHY